MLWLTLDAKLVCKHELGVVQNQATQNWVTVEGRPVLVATNPEKRPIKGCPNVSPGIKPCTQTLKVRAGYSSLLQIDDRPVCLSHLVGLTDGTPPGVVDYIVRGAGQNFVSESN